MLRITAEREKRGLTKFKLGATVGIHPAQVGKLESGRIKPYQKELDRFENFFGIPGEELFKEVIQNG